MVALAMDTDGALAPIDVLEVDRQRLVAAQATVIDQPEQGTIARVADAAECRLDLFGIQRTRAVPRLWPSLQAVE